MKNLQVILFYLVRTFILIIFSFILMATIEYSMLVQLFVLLMIVLYFSLYVNRLEYSLFEIHYHKKDANIFLTILRTMLSVLLNGFLVGLLFLEFYQFFILVIAFECSLKIFVGSNLEEKILFRKITFKGDIHEAKV